MVVWDGQNGGSGQYLPPVLRQCWASPIQLVKYQQLLVDKIPRQEVKRGVAAFHGDPEKGWDGVP